ncbi:hypothetical protein SAMN02745181_3143 [Rubritalea squalenifaciens DSM 18772]|uniref:Uncharacterized protein n=2 Tax=Rubritalea TaxID=361050 RepID=A0A1M6PC97_9BACT|nr:hypothetical protein [Rubritalea squalenifaciens]SHK05575.1 hypothetical protein SAMN02745181_3143 [Rubritalea squalenifaciens DSM 18772]
MIKPQKILLGKGLDDLPFGLTQDQVKEVLGDPEERDQVDLGDEMSIAWHYWDLGISLNFDESENYGLTSIDVASPEVTLFGKALIGMTREEVKDFLDSQSIGQSVDEVHNGLVYPDVELSLWFSGGELSEIQWAKL